MKKVGNQTIVFDIPPTVLETACIGGPKEANGPLAKYFDQVLDDEFWGEASWEKAESKIIKETVNRVVAKSKISQGKIEYCFSGDLLNQCISSGFGLRDLNVPYLGIFGACSTFVEGMGLSALFCNTPIANYALCATSSHFCSAEKQFRFPLELGNQRPQTSQWTVTGAGSALVSKSGQGPFITSFTPGKIVDMGIKDVNNMGAAMAPAALNTLIAHFHDTGRSPSYYDGIFTGDLGYVGKDILSELSLKYGYNFSSNYNDCGVMIFDKSEQDTHSGGSGCACCATVFSGFLFNQLKQKKFKKILLVATGALTNATSAQQGESIPSIAHAISIEI